MSTSWKHSWTASSIPEIVLGADDRRQAVEGRVADFGERILEEPLERLDRRVGEPELAEGGDGVAAHGLIRMRRPGGERLDRGTVAREAQREGRVALDLRVLRREALTSTGNASTLSLFRSPRTDESIWVSCFF
jgi:hypothetical protein